MGKKSHGRSCQAGTVRAEPTLAKGNSVHTLKERESSWEDEPGTFGNPGTGGKG
jgi:hypothetical protein